MASLMAGCGANEAKSQDTSTTTAQESVQETETNTEVNTETEESDAKGSNYLSIAEQGIFSAGGSVIESDGTFDVSNYYTSREGSTSRVDHANVFYQIPANDTELPMVFLYGYGQSRMAWMTTPDGREGWSDMFLKKGHMLSMVLATGLVACGSGATNHQAENETTPETREQTAETTVLESETPESVATESETGTTEEAEVNTDEETGKVLVVYYSATGHWHFKWHFGRKNIICNKEKFSYNAVTDCLNA